MYERSPSPVRVVHRVHGRPPDAGAFVHLDQISGFAHPLLFVQGIVHDPHKRRVVLPKQSNRSVRLSDLAPPAFIFPDQRTPRSGLDGVVQAQAGFALQATDVRANGDILQGDIVSGPRG